MRERQWVGERAVGEGEGSEWERTVRGRGQWVSERQWVG